MQLRCALQVKCRLWWSGLQSLHHLLLKKNRDYVGDRRRVGVSVPYVGTDLEVLRSRCVILPRTIWRKAFVQDDLWSAMDGIDAHPLPQFNARVVNTHLKKQAAKAKRLEAELRGTAASSWIDQMEGYAKGYPYRFLVEMDEVLKTLGDS